MLYLIDGLVGIFSVQVIYQDFKSRNGNLLVLIALAVLTACAVYGSYTTWPVFRFAGFNMSFLLLLFFTQLVLVWVRKRKWINPVNKSIGLFDILYLFLLSFWFSPRNFLLLLILAAGAGSMHGFIAIRQGKTARIPFAAYLAIVHLLFMALALGTKGDLYHDAFIKNLFVR